MIRRHFELLGVDPLVRVGDEALLERLLNRAAEEAMEAAYETPTEEQEVLFDTAAPDTIAEMAERLRKFLLAMPDPWEWAEKAGFFPICTGRRAFPRRRGGTCPSSSAGRISSGRSARPSPRRQSSGRAMPRCGSPGGKTGNRPKRLSYTREYRGGTRP